jgi:carbonic anhydrase
LVLRHSFVIRISSFVIFTMPLFDAIIEANHRSAPNQVTVDVQNYADELPVVALTCIDPRLNRLLPETLGIPEEQFIWLRNAGNIIFDSMSSMTRTLALACAIKGGKEIAIIGHTDCKVGKMSMVELTDRFRALGLDRSRLPDNLNEFFGLFASERQNVMRAADLIRQSPLIGPKIPVHGLLMDIQTGKVEWIVNGYQTLAAVVSQPATITAPTASHLGTTIPLPEFNIGEMKFPETKIGEVATRAADMVSSVAHQVETIAEKVSQTIHQHTRPTEAAAEVASQTPQQGATIRVHPGQMYNVMGDDQKIYGPVLGDEVERWLADGRIDLNTLAQKVGDKNWKRLADFAGKIKFNRDQKHPPPPPSIPFSQDPKRFK